MSKGIPKSSCWLKRIKQQQGMGRQLNNGLFVDTCHSSRSLQRKRLTTDNHFLFTLEFSPNGSFLATGDNQVQLWPINKVLDREMNKPITLIVASSYIKRMFNALAFSPDNRRLFSSSFSSSRQDGEIVIYDLERYRLSY